MKVVRMIPKLLAVLFSLLIFVDGQSTEDLLSCLTPFQEPGICRRGDLCPKLAIFLQEQRESLHIEVKNYLDKSIYWIWRGRAYYCCPLETELTSTTTASPLVEYGGRCKTNNNGRGYCHRMSQCSRFASFHGKKWNDLPKSAQSLLRNSFCGKLQNSDLFCCPSDSIISSSTTTSTRTPPASTTVSYRGICWTPNAHKGKCIKAKDCPQFAEALNIHPVSEAIQKAVNESLCGRRKGVDLVCCPDEDTIIQTTSVEPVTEAIEVVGLSCQTADGETGTCMSETDCPQNLRDLLADNTSSTSNNESLCGMQDNIRTICCPPLLDPAEAVQRCPTPSGDDGYCISLDECSTLSSLLDHGLTKSVLNKLLSLHCGQDDMATYCCPSLTIDNEDNNDLRRHQSFRLLDENNCGKSPLFRPLEDDTEIGKKAKLSTIPWMALIDYKNDTTSQFRCVGSIISSRYILTAARCVTNLNGNTEPVSVRLGEHNLDYPLDCKDETCAPAPQNIYIEKSIPHPEFIGNPSHLNDIAVIRLAKDINFSTGSVKPVCLPVEESLQEKDFTGKKLLVSGWFTDREELSPELLQDVVEGVSYKDCSMAYENMTAISTDIHMCVLNGRHDDCLGKGASPLVSFEEVMGRKAAVQQGIGLFGTDNCYLSTQPVVYTRVGKFVKWILDNMRP